MKDHIEQTAAPWRRNTIGRLAVILFCMLTAAVLCCCGKKEDKQIIRKVTVPADFNNAMYTIGCVRDTTSYEEATPIKRWLY